MEKKCPRCGAALPPGALEGLCPACLLQQGATAETGPENAAFDPPSVEEVSKLFTNLEILDFIGKGGMGAVYKARQPALDRLVALKVISPHIVSEPGFTERFNREARALARLSHPNIVAVHEFGEVSGLRYFVMEYVDGLTLRQLERSGQLTSREALAIVPQICAALQYAHDEGIVHRDIKPENILLDKRGRVKIADFGIAKIMGREADVALFQTKGAIGTPQYMAPEQLETPRSVDHRADIFSLGVVFYEMLTGELPLGKFSPPSGKVRVDVRLDDVVLRALEKEPERRYQHASDVKTDVESIAGVPGTNLPPPPDPVILQKQILATDCALNIGSCVQRGWDLVKADFWRTVGVTALGLLLIQAAWSTAVGFVAGGPLAAGLSLYYLKRIRKEKDGVATLFSGFNISFAQLALGGAIIGVLTFLGFLCFLVPGIILSVLWWFALTIMIDKRLEFWPAMELSRKVVMKRFWKFLGFWLLCILFYAVGAVVCGVGFFITAPIALAAATFAYVDIFCDPALPPIPGQLASGFTPAGTAILAGATPAPATSSAALGSAKPSFWPVALVIIALAGMVMGLALVIVERGRHRSEIQRAAQEAALRGGLTNLASSEAADGADATATNSAAPGKALSEKLKLRMEAAATISEPAARDRALAVLATDAAEAGDGGIALRSATRIGEPAKRDQTARKAAQLLNQRGSKKDAILLSKSIMDPALRDATLAEMAQ